MRFDEGLQRPPHTQLARRRYYFNLEQILAPALSFCAWAGVRAFGGCRVLGGGDPAAGDKAKRDRVRVAARRFEQFVRSFDFEGAGKAALRFK